MNNKIIDAAKAAGWSDLQLNLASPTDHERLARFYAIAYRAGLEDAAKVCDEQQTEGECPERASYCAEAIRALKDQT